MSSIKIFVNVFKIKKKNNILKIKKAIMTTKNTLDQHLKPGEQYLHYRQRVLDTKSDTFCGAKWYYATIWLNSGMTTSCHHPLPHHVSEDEVRANYKALSNTPRKKQERTANL